MKKIKMEKGITLIALIITIVLLLILAVVTIGAINESKIIKHSQNASNEYIIAQEKEQIQLALSEWQIQKNTLGNTNTFKSVMETELSNNATVSGENDGPLTVIFKETENEYTVTNDGNIKEIVKLSKTDLEKYILGNDLNGRNLMEIINSDTDGNLYLIDNPEIKLLLLLDSDEGSDNMYIKYDNKTYKFKVDYETGLTDSDYGLVEIEIDTASTRVGKTVQYDDKIWTILYDDETNGLQMVSNEVYKYNGEYDFYLGCRNSAITDWSKLDTTTDEFKISDLDNNGKIDNDFEKAIYSYNTAIETLNNACENVVSKNDNIEDVRCVGSDPIKKNKENATSYTSENWTTETKGNGKGKSSDLNYVTDFDRMATLEINRAYNSPKGYESYWLASRKIVEDTDRTEFCMNCVTKNDDDIVFRSKVWIWYMDGRTDKSWEMYTINSLRPVVKLKSDVQFNGTGTADDPFTIAE